MSWEAYPRYINAAERRLRADKAVRKMIKGGRSLAPVNIEGRKIANTFWGKSWCDNLEAYSDFSNRLPRGRSYVRNGSVIDLQIKPGRLTALVQGSELYRISVTIRPPGASRWREFKSAAAGKIANLLDLLQGRLGKDLLADISATKSGLFPEPCDIEFECSCPDYAGMCKHVAATLYGVGARLDSEPHLFFTLRGLDMQELITAASAGATNANADASAATAALAGADLSEIFGVDIEPVQAAPAAPKKVKRAKPVAVKKNKAGAKPLKR